MKDDAEVKTYLQNPVQTIRLFRGLGIHQYSAYIQYYLCLELKNSDTSLNGLHGIDDKTNK